MISQIPRAYILQMKRREKEGIAAVQCLFEEAFEIWKDDPVKLAELSAELMWMSIQTYNHSSRPTFRNEYKAMYETTQHYASEYSNPIQYKRFVYHFRTYWEAACPFNEVMFGAQPGRRPS